MFVQESYRHARIHADWIYRHLTEATRAALRLYDPFLGYLVAIAATLHLDQSVSSKANVAKAAEHKFVTCREFVRKLSESWPNISNFVSKCHDWPLIVILAKLLQLRVVDLLALRTRQRQAGSYIEDEYDGMIRPLPKDSASLHAEDTALFAALLDYTTTLGTSPEAFRSSLARYAPAGDFAGNVDIPEEPTTITIGEPDSSHLAESDEFLQQVLGFEDDDWSLFGVPWSTYFGTQSDAML